jgi:Tol biopolymer transport system component
MMDASGSNVVQLTTTGFDKHVGSWSPDGATLLFYTVFGSPETSPDEAGIYALQIGGTGVTHLYGSYALGASWSRDGTRIAFAGGCDEGTDMEICVMNADGSNVVALTNNDAIDTEPDW